MRGAESDGYALSWSESPGDPRDILSKITNSLSKAAKSIGPYSLQLDPCHAGDSDKITSFYKCNRDGLRALIPTVLSHFNHDGTTGRLDRITELAGFIDDELKCTVRVIMGDRGCDNNVLRFIMHGVLPILLSCPVLFRPSCPLGRHGE